MRPDGLHVQDLRCPAFPALENLPFRTDAALDDGVGDFGTVCYWVKRPADRQWGNNRAWCDLTCVLPGPAGTAALGIGRRDSVATGSDWGFLVENHQAGVDGQGTEDFEHLAFARLALREPDLRWRLVVAHFDTDVLVPGEDMGYAALGIGGGEATPSTLYPNPYTRTLVARLATASGFVLGSQVWDHPSSRANQVLDELAICDFGDDVAAARDATGKWASPLYKAGRYYKRDDAAFTSVPLPGGRLLRAWWTAVLPRHPRIETERMLTGEGLPFPRPADPLLADASLRVTLLDEAGTPVRELSQGGRMDEALQRFHYRVTLASGVADLLNDPVLETPFLDDITFAWQGAAGPRLSAWRQS